MSIRPGPHEFDVIIPESAYEELVAWLTDTDERWGVCSHTDGVYVVRVEKNARVAEKLADLGGLPLRPGEGYECWAWLEMQPNGVEGLISAIVPALEHLGVIPLQHRRRDIAEQHLGVVARMHGTAAGHAVRLVHLVEEPEE